MKEATGKPDSGLPSEQTVVAELRKDKPVKVGEWVTFEPHPTKKGKVLIKSRREPEVFAQIDTMIGLRFALRILAMAERKR